MGYRSMAVLNLKEASWDKTEECNRQLDSLVIFNDDDTGNGHQIDR
jgi:hypothetical protein